MEIIQRIEYNHGYAQIAFESGWKVWLKKSAVTHITLLEGMRINRQEFEKFILFHQYPGALEKAVALLAERARSRKEIEERLQRTHYDPEVISLVICKLDKEGLLDDLDFAEQWVQSRMKKYGAQRIAQELHRKGIDSETVSKAMKACSEEEQLENALLLAERKIRSMKNITDKRILCQKVAGMLVRRGYTWETAKKAFESAADAENIL